MRTRMKDVAARAGVSTKTVSNVVNDVAHVTPQTRARVETALTELGYVTNLTARALRNGRTGSILLALPGLHLPYFSELAHHVVTAARERGWTVHVDETGGDHEREREILSGVRTHLVDGVVLNPVVLTPGDLPDDPSACPVVLLGEAQQNLVDQVQIANVAATRAAVELLIGAGRKRIAAIGIDKAAPGSRGATGAQRARGFHTALSAAQHRPDPALIAPGASWERADGFAAMRTLLDLPDPPDAVFCCNDLLAIGALRALYEAGVRVPEQVAVIGFDNIEEAAYCNPSLTTVAPDIQLMAHTALELLAERISGFDGGPRRIRAPYALKLRESTPPR